MSSEVEETLRRIQSHKGVQGVIIMNGEGVAIRYDGFIYKIIINLRVRVRVRLTPPNKSEVGVFRPILVFICVYMSNNFEYNYYFPSLPFYFTFL